MPLESMLGPAVLILLPLAVGILARYFHLFEPFFEILYKLVVIIILPALVFGSVAVVRPIGILSLSGVTILALICIAVTSLTVLACFSLIDVDMEKKTEIFMNATFMNYTFLGLAVVHSIIGTRALAYASLYAVTVGIIHLTIGMGATKISTKEEIDPLEVVYDILTFPAMFALIVALLFVFFETGLPIGGSIAESLMDEYANFASFLMVLATAYKMEIGSLKKHLSSVFSVGVLRLILGPLVTFFAIEQLGIDWNMGRVALLLSAMPPGIFNVILAERFDLDKEAYSTEVFYLTIVSLFVVIPFLLHFLFPGYSLV